MGIPRERRVFALPANDLNLAAGNLRTRIDCHTDEQIIETPQTAAEVDAIRAIHHWMIDAWNEGDGAGFAAAWARR